jgi:hypothetical protein
VNSTVLVQFPINVPKKEERALVPRRAISEIGILSTTMQLATAALLFFTADIGKSEIPAPDATREINVGISPAICETSGDYSTVENSQHEHLENSIGP